MPLVLIVLGLHILAALFWLLSSFILARASGAGSQKMFRWQMAAATLAIFTGGGLWSMFHRGLFGPAEMILAGGALCAIAAAGVQGAMVGGPIRRLKSGALGQEEALRRITLGQRISAGLLAVALITMVAAPHALP
ncbi:MAG: hypothetical protein JWO72_2966 [Caulobacteraceae bacterium]|nr:hypothetical protein [Caulobacteraceae bacterium]